jgi:H+/Cl- antiporter ClcA
MESAASDRKQRRIVEIAAYVAIALLVVATFVELYWTWGGTVAEDASSQEDVSDTAWILLVLAVTLIGAAVVVVRLKAWRGNASLHDSAAAPSDSGEGS